MIRFFFETCVTQLSRSLSLSLSWCVCVCVCVRVRVCAWLLCGFVSFVSVVGAFVHALHSTKKIVKIFFRSPTSFFLLGSFGKRSNSLFCYDESFTWMLSFRLRFTRAFYPQVPTCVSNGQVCEFFSFFFPGVVVRLTVARRLNLSGVCVCCCASHLSCVFFGGRCLFVFFFCLVLSPLPDFFDHGFFRVLTVHTQSLDVHARTLTNAQGVCVGLCSTTDSVASSMFSGIEGTARFFDRGARAAADWRRFFLRYRA